MKNSAYLKGYVKNHPENKMAWYLLGKEYESAGQEAKAQYCYIQAGSVYEAFEATKVPADLWQEYQDKLVEESKRKEKKKGLIRKIGIVLVFLLLINLSAAYAPGQFAVVPSVEDDSGLTVEDISSLSVEELGLAVKDSDPGSEAAWLGGEGVSALTTEFTAGAYESNPDNPYKSLEDMYGEELATTASRLVVLGMKKKAEWLIWTKDMPVVYELDRSPQDGVMKVQSYDPKACLCTPPDASGLQKEGKAWIERQESLAVLSTAIRNYKQQSGEWPEHLDQLVQPFPDNWLAGRNPLMRREFSRVLDIQKKAATGKAGEAKGQNVSEDELFGGANGEALFFKEPLRIVVDKDAHVLAVVSGKIILRSYKIGLGGSKTPEGTYQISDKVINPNGRDDGEFGSRGMQLSDTNYAIHGTNEPDSIGKDESLGCIRMLKKDIEELFDLMPRGSKVEIGKGILPRLESVPKERFVLKRSQDQTNPHRTYHWL